MCSCVCSPTGAAILMSALPRFFLASTGAALVCRKLLTAMRARGRAGISPAIYIDMYTAGVFGFLFFDVSGFLYTHDSPALKSRASAGDSSGRGAVRLAVCLVCVRSLVQASLSRERLILFLFCSIGRSQGVGLSTGFGVLFVLFSVLFTCPFFLGCSWRRYPARSAAEVCSTLPVCSQF